MAKVAISVQTNVCYHIYALSNMIGLRTFAVLTSLCCQLACGIFIGEIEGEPFREAIDSW